MYDIFSWTPFYCNRQPPLSFVYNNSKLFSVLQNILRRHICGRQLSLRKCSFHDLFWRRKLWTNLILLKWKFLRIIIRHLILEMSTVVYNILRIQVTKICIFVLMFYSRLISFNTAGQRDQAGSLELLIVAFGLKMNPLYGNLCTS